MATGLFASKAVNSAGADGLFYGGGMTLLVKQATGVGIAIAIAVVGTLVISMIIKPITGLRVNEDEEDAGLDLALHGESAYAGPSLGSETEGSVLDMHFASQATPQLDQA